MAGIPGQNHPSDGGGGGGGGGPDGAAGTHGLDDYNGTNGGSGSNTIPLGSATAEPRSAGHGYISISYTNENGILFDGGVVTVSEGRVRHEFRNPGEYNLVSIYQFTRSRTKKCQEAINKSTNWDKERYGVYN